MRNLSTIEPVRGHPQGIAGWPLNARWLLWQESNALKDAFRPNSFRKEDNLPPKSKNSSNNGLLCPEYSRKPLNRQPGTAQSRKYLRWSRDRPILCLSFDAMRSNLKNTSVILFWMLTHEKRDIVSTSKTSCDWTQKTRKMRHN